MYLWFISFKMWMKTRHATPPWQADRLAKCQICPQLPLMLRHKRDIELLRRSPAMFVEYQLGLGPAWALFQELEWEEEAFKCVKNMKQNEEKDLISKKYSSVYHNCTKKTKPKVIIGFLCLLLCSARKSMREKNSINCQLSIKCAMLFSLSSLTYHSL